MKRAVHDKQFKMAAVKMAQAEDQSVLNTAKEEDITMGINTQLTEEQKKLSYAKYLYMPMAPIPEEKLAALKAGPMDPSKALRIEDRAELLKPGYMEREQGFCVMGNGTGYGANLTFMPNTTTEMLFWWYIWSSLEVTRYKIWDPDDHISLVNLDRDMSLDQSMPLLNGCGDRFM